MKMLIPSVAAGAIIGKGGETIAEIQKNVGARIKMSKPNDFYPGTNERICLITGSKDAISTIVHFLNTKIKVGGLIQSIEIGGGGGVSEITWKD